MNKTLIDGILGAILSKSVEKNNAIVRGWYFSGSNLYKHIRAKYDNTICSVDVELRNDIAKTPDGNNIDVNTWVTKIPLDKFVDMQIKINNEWITYLSFNTRDLQKSNVEDTINTNNIPLSTPQKSEPKKAVSFVNCAINYKLDKVIHTINDFYSDPNNIRKYGQSILKNEIQGNIFTSSHIYKNMFQEILNKQISDSKNNSINGNFFLKYVNNIFDSNNEHEYIAIICLSPQVHMGKAIEIYEYEATENGSSKLKHIDRIQNVFNKAIIFNAKNYKIKLEGFGENMDEGCLFQIFAFNTES